MDSIFPFEIVLGNMVLEKFVVILELKFWVELKIVVFETNEKVLDNVWYRIVFVEVKGKLIKQVVCVSFELLFRVVVELLAVALLFSFSEDLSSHEKSVDCVARVYSLIGICKEKKKVWFK